MDNLVLDSCVSFRKSSLILVNYVVLVLSRWCRQHNVLFTCSLLRVQTYGPVDFQVLPPGDGGIITALNVGIYLQMHICQNPVNYKFKMVRTSRHAASQNHSDLNAYFDDI